MNGQPHKSAALSPGNCPHYPLNRGLGESQSRSGRFGVNFTSVGNRNDLPVRKLFVQAVNMRRRFEQLLICIVEVVGSTHVHQHKS